MPEHFVEDKLKRDIAERACDSSTHPEILTFWVGLFTRGVAADSNDTARSSEHAKKDAKKKLGNRGGEESRCRVQNAGLGFVDGSDLRI